MEVYGLVLEMNQDAAKLIIENREDVKKNEDLGSLVSLYFKSSSKTYELCKSIENCVKRAETSQLIIKLAVNHFDRESMETEHHILKYAQTLKELNSFKAIGDPFDGDFLTQYESVYEEQILLLEELHMQKVKLDKKQKIGKSMTTLLNVVFVTSFISFLVLSVDSAAMGAQDVLSALASALGHPIEYGRNWCSQLWKEYENALESKRGLVFSMAVQTMINREAMKAIRCQVDRLRSTIASILGLVEIAVEREEDEYAIRLVMQKIKEKVSVFDWIIKQANHYIASGRLQVLEHILGLPLNNNLDSKHEKW